MNGSKLTVGEVSTGRFSIFLSKYNHEGVIATTHIANNPHMQIKYSIDISINCVRHNMGNRMLLLVL